MVQWLRTLIVLPKDPDLIPTIHRVAHNCLIPVPLLASNGTIHLVQRYRFRKNTHTHSNIDIRAMFRVLNVTVL